jgi:hypothetical protein
MPNYQYERSGIIYKIYDGPRVIAICEHACDADNLVTVLNEATCCHECEGSSVPEFTFCSSCGIKHKEQDQAIKDLFKP